MQVGQRLEIEMPSTGAVNVQRKTHSSRRTFTAFPPYIHIYIRLYPRLSLYFSSPFSREIRADRRRLPSARNIARLHLSPRVAKHDDLRPRRSDFPPHLQTSRRLPGLFEIFEPIDRPSFRALRGFSHFQRSRHYRRAFRESTRQLAKKRDRLPPHSAETLLAINVVVSSFLEKFYRRVPKSCNRPIIPEFCRVANAIILVIDHRARNVNEHEI